MKKKLVIIGSTLLLGGMVTTSVLASTSDSTQNERFSNDFKRTESRRDNDRLMERGSCCYDRYQVD